MFMKISDKRSTTFFLFFEILEDRGHGISLSNGHLKINAISSTWVAFNSL